MVTVDVRGRRDVRGAGGVFGLLLVAVILRTAGASQAQISAAAADPQGYVTAAGADQFVLVLATAIGWLLLGWVTLGAVLLLGSAAPGWLGWLFTCLARLLLPATLRRFVSLALGITLLTGTSVASAAPPATMAAISVTLDWPELSGSAIADVPDWPTEPPAMPGPVPGTTPAPPATPVPDPPTAPAPSPQGTTSQPGSYLVQPGDCLWDIAERELALANRPIDSGSIAAAVTAWWRANSDQIQDPDLIYPGQLLQAPAP